MGLVSPDVDPETTARTPSVEVVAGVEHREKEHNPGVGLQGHKQTQKLGLPVWVADRGYASAIRANHLFRVYHEQREDDADEGQNQEANLLKLQSLSIRTARMTYICAITDWG